MPYERTLTQYITPFDELIIRDVSSPLHGRYYYDNPWYPFLPCLKHLPMSERARTLANDARKATIEFSAMIRATTWEQKRDSSLRIFAIVYKWAREDQCLANFCVDEQGNLGFNGRPYKRQPDVVSLRQWLEGNHSSEIPYGLQILGVWNLIGATAHADDEEHFPHFQEQGHDAVRYAAEHARHFGAMVMRYLEGLGWSSSRTDRCLRDLYHHLVLISTYFPCQFCRATCAYYFHFFDRYLYPWSGKYSDELPYKHCFISQEHELRHWLSISQLPVSEVTPPAPPALPRSSSSRSSLATVASIWNGRRQSQPKYGLDVLLDELKLADLSALPASLRIHKKDYQLFLKDWAAGGGKKPSRGNKFDIRLWQ